MSASRMLRRPALVFAYLCFLTLATNQALADDPSQVGAWTPRLPASPDGSVDHAIQAAHSMKSGGGTVANRPNDDIHSNSCRDDVVTNEVYTADNWTWPIPARP